MASSATLSLSSFHPTPTSISSSSSVVSEFKRISSSPPASPSSTTDKPTSVSPPQSPSSGKLKGSPQLNRWSRARSIRSGRKLDRPTHRSPTPVMDPDSPPRPSLEGEFKSPLLSPVTDRDSVEYDGDLTVGKSIYLVSDGTGWTAEHAVNAALGQFEHCLVDRACAVNTHLFSGIDDIDRLMEIIRQAAKEEAMLVYTLADPSMAESARKACQLWGVPSNDILGPITEAVASHLGVSPSGLSRWAPGRDKSLSEEYFQRVEAVEFTIKQDDGALPENLRKADIILAGVSRTGKTPLSIYLAQKGYKVANIPIVMGIELPKTLFEVDPEKVFGLTINPVVLLTIRRARSKSLGFGQEVKSNYSEMEYVKRELKLAAAVFSQNPAWPVIDVTAKAIEETAAVVLRLYHDRKDKCSMPRISKRY